MFPRRIAFVAICCLLTGCPQGSGSRIAHYRGGGSSSGGGPAISPDGAYILFSAPRTGHGDIYRVNIDGSNVKQLTTDVNGEFDAECSPDGKQIMFVREGSGQADIWIRNADGAGQMRLTNRRGDQGCPKFTPSGSQMAYWRTVPGWEFPVGYARARELYSVEIKAGSGMPFLDCRKLVSRLTFRRNSPHDLHLTEGFAVLEPTGSVPEELLLGQYIPLHYHFNMLQDAARMDAFREAIDCIVPVGGKVLELGGGTGVLSYFAAQRAEKVWCVERNPALVRAARSFLANNPGGERVEVVHADAMSYLPPEPVDVVICEMLHVALIREKQLEVIQSFKDRSVRAFGPRLPAFIPDVSLLGVQLLEQNFCFSGYTAPVPLFLPPGFHAKSRLLSDPQIYSTVSYDAVLPRRFAWESAVPIQHAGTLNAVGFLTKNFLAFVLEEQRGIEWMMNQLVLPLANPLEVRSGDTVCIQFAYDAGCPLETLQASLSVERAAQSLPVRRAA